MPHIMSALKLRLTGFLKRINRISVTSFLSGIVPATGKIIMKPAKRAAIHLMGSLKSDVRRRLLKKNEFSRNILRFNGLSEKRFQKWVFYPGMLFDSRDKWWGDARSRFRPHEGLDICFYRDNNGRALRLGARASIPVMYDGKVVIIDDDFLGKSVFVKHSIFNNGMQLVTVYGHIEPYSCIYKGSIVNEGDIVGTISDAGNKNAAIISHLHVSMAWISGSLPCEALNWKIMGDRDLVILLNPLEYISCKHIIIPFSP